MRATLELPLPRLSKGRFMSVSAYTDEVLFDTCGVRIAFTERSGGVSCGPYKSLNLGAAVGDEKEAVIENRRILRAAFSSEDCPCIVPLQVHGDTMVIISENKAEYREKYQRLASEGADAVMVEVPRVAALLCFADCIPLIIVSPTGRFVVIHAGWRGVKKKIALAALEGLRERDEAEASNNESGPMNVSRNKGAVEGYNVYFGPFIHAECFETDMTVHTQFTDSYGQDCAPDARHIDLGFALRASLVQAGIQADRIADVGICTVCANDRFFSYRAQDGVCGRHGAFAIRM